MGFVCFLFSLCVYLNRNPNSSIVKLPHFGEEKKISDLVIHQDAEEETGLSKAHEM